MISAPTPIKGAAPLVDITTITGVISRYVSPSIGSGQPKVLSGGGANWTHPELDKPIPGCSDHL